MSSSKHQPLISIIVAVYNGKGTLQQCIESVTEQTFKSVELIVIDGGSTDGSVEFLKNNSAKLTYWLSEPDAGIYNAWNKALVRAKGEWICFLGADDFLWAPDVLAKMGETLLQLASETQLVFGQIMLLDKNDKALYSIGDASLGQKSSIPNVMKLPPHPALMHRRRLFDVIGNFDESFRIAGDTDLLVRALRQTQAQFVPNLIVAGMRQGGVSSQPLNVLKLLGELRRIEVVNGVALPRLNLILLWFRAVVRLFMWRLLGERVTRKVMDLWRVMSGRPKYWTRT